MPTHATTNWSSIARLPLAVAATPALVALFAYLDAKFHISSDWALIYKFIRISILAKFVEKKDRLNTFYILEDWALSKTHCTKTFLKFGGKSWTYRQAYENSLKYGTWAKETHGVKSGDIVAMDVMNSETFVWLWFGLWSIGAKPAFVNYNITGAPLVHTIKTSTTKLVFASGQFQDKYAGEVLSEIEKQTSRDDGGSVKVVFLTDAAKAEIEVTEARRAPDEERGGQELKSMALLIYTSGTTGKSVGDFLRSWNNNKIRSAKARRCELDKGFCGWMVPCRLAANEA